MPTLRQAVYGTAVQGQELQEIETTSRERQKEMKIYVDEKNQDVRIDFGAGEYARVSISQFTGEVFTGVAPANWLPDTLGDSELVYESPEPEWKVGDVVPVGTVVGRKWSGLYEGGDNDGVTRVVNYEPDADPVFERRIVWIEGQ